MDDNLEALLQQRASEIRNRVYKEAYANIETLVTKTLEEQNEALLAKILGMSRRWGGEWEVDHCNGRSGQSEIGPLIKDKMASAAAEVINEALGDWEPSAKIIAAIRKEFDLMFEREALNVVRNLAARRAQEYVAKLLEG